jgi:hypothetical protein
LISIRSGDARDDTPPACPLCGADRAPSYHRDRQRAYWRCRRCALIFVSPDAWVSADIERARYDQHRNEPGDTGYRRFLARLADPVVERVPHNAVGLDFGSGPGPTLAGMLEERGLRMSLYDPFYAADPTVWEQRYDVITASEVVEHLRDPRGELDRLFKTLRPNGLLAVMTQWAEPREWFVGSRYIRDPTHVCFFCPETCRWIAAHWAVGLEIPVSNVALFRRSPDRTRRG